MSIYSSNRKERRSSRIHLGHLKISIIEDSSALVVQIFEARGLLRKEGGSLDTYVKLYVLPDPQKKSKEKTRIVRQKDPIFNEKFSFVLNDRDYEKMLFIAVWTHQTTSRNEMIGCMTFKVRDLVGPNKTINGWYQVLDTARGRLENAQVPTSISKYEAAISKYENEVPRGHKVFGVTIMKSNEGYGFSVYEKNPVFITKVVPGLPAANADLRDGDVILEVEGQDVRRVNGPHVVEIVRNCQLTLHMVVDRPPKAHLRHRSHTQKSQSNHLLNPFNSLSRNRSKSHMSVSPNEAVVHGAAMMDTQGSVAAPINKRNRYSANYSSQSFLYPEYHANPYLPNSNFPSPPLSSRPRGPGEAQFNASFMAGAYGVPGVLSQPVPMMYASQGGHGMQLQVPPSYENRIMNERCGNLTADESGVYMGGAGRGNAMSYGTALVKNSSSRRGVFRNNSSINHAAGRGEEPVAMRTEYSALSQPSELGPELIRGAGSMRAPQPVRHPSVDQEIERRASLTQHNDDKLENAAIGQSPFIRTASLSPYHSSAVGYRQIHGNLVQQRRSVTPSTSPEPEGNLSDGSESLVEWESLTILEQKRQEVIHTLFMAERNLVKVLSAGMETYYLPLKSILPEISHQKIFLAIPEMLEYSTTIADHLKRRQVPYTMTVATAETYIYAVADIYASKCPDMVSNFQTYLKNFQVSRQEIALSFTNEPFTRLVQESVEKKNLPSIYAFVEEGKEYVQKLCKCMITLLYHTQLSHQDQNHLHNIVDALLPLTADRDLVAQLEKDKEVMRKKQVCIGFGPKMHSFPIMVPGRFLIHEGEMFVIEKKKKKKIWLMLFSDILLMTRKNGRILTCTEQPALLENLTVSDINCTEPTEFQVALVEGTFSRQLRGGTVAIRDEWLEKLKERASGSLANRKKAAAEKGHSHRYHQDILKKESQVLAATLAVDTEPEVVAHNLMTPIPESVSGSTLEKRAGVVTDQNKMSSKSSPDITKDQPPLKRGISKRRSLFTLGKKGDSESGPEASGTSTKGKKHKKKGNAKSPSSKPPTPEETLTLSMIPVDVLRSWETSFSALLAHEDGIKLFENYLKSEFSEENIQFWMVCERFKGLPDHQVEKEAAIIYGEYIDPQASKLVNIDHQTTKAIEDSRERPHRKMFMDAQQSIYLLMARDSFVRFIKSEPFQAAVKR